MIFCVLKLLFLIQIVVYTNFFIIFQNMKELSKIQNGDIKIQQQVTISLPDNQNQNVDDIIKIEQDPIFQSDVIIKQLDEMRQNNNQEKVYVTATSLKDKFDYLLPILIQKPNTKKKSKATNIPKFLLKVFNNNLPDLSYSHKIRIKHFFENLSNSKTRFDLVKIFGKDEQNREVDRQNQINRNILKRLLSRNFDNILRNKHIRNKKLYLLFCKKVILRLSNPNVLDRLQI